MSKPSRRSRGTLTIEDVARAAGVSAMTVSRVINKERNVREETRLAVLETIERLNYSPNTAARNLAAGEATHIGLLYSNPSAAYLSQFLVGALESARAAGVPPRHRAVRVGGRSRAVRRRPAVSRRPTPKGVILPPPLSESVPILTELALVEHAGRDRRDGPALSQRAQRADRRFRGGEGDDRLSDRPRASPDRAHHGPPRTYRQRTNGSAASVAAVDGAGLSPRRTCRSSRAFHLPLRPRRGRAAARPSEPPTAIFASNDDMAAAVISVAHRRGLARAGRSHRRRLRRHRARDHRLAGADDHPPAGLGDGRSGARAAARRPAPPPPRRRTGCRRRPCSSMN